MTVDPSPVKFTPTLPGQPVPEIAAISGDRPVFRAELPDGRIVWLVSGYENVRQMLIDQRFSRALAVAPGRARQGFEMFAAGSVNGMDPPGHTRLRKLVASAFTARRVEALRPRVAGIVGQLIDAMAGRPQPADLVAGFSLPLPAQVICEMLGVPAEDLGQFHAWSDTIMADWQRDSDEIMTALAELYGYFGALANRDPPVFGDPDRFDVTRDAAGHLSFGAGVHHCLGAQLARVELQEAFRGLIGRLPGLRIAVPASDLEFKPGMAIHSLRELPVLWDQP